MKSYSLEELYVFISRFHLSDSLYFIGAINAALKYGFKGINSKDIPPYIIDWIKLHDDNRKIHIFLQLSRLARFLLLSEANDHRNSCLIPGTDNFTKVYNMLRDLSEFSDEERPIDERGWNTVFGRLSAWQFTLQTDRLITIGRGYLLFIKIPQEIRPQYNFD